jgi:hypothetical protein
MDILLWASVTLNAGLLFIVWFLYEALRIENRAADSAQEHFEQLRNLYDKHFRQAKAVAAKRRRTPGPRNLVAGPGYDGPGVYILHCQGRHKIGHSSNITKRLRSYGTAIPFSWEVYALIPARQPEALEAEFHERLAVYRVQGEWFDFGSDLTPLNALIAEMRQEEAA